MFYLFIIIIKLVNFGIPEDVEEILRLFSYSKKLLVTTFIYLRILLKKLNESFLTHNIDMIRL